MPNEEHEKITEERMHSWWNDEAMFAPAFLELKMLNKKADELKRAQAILRRAIETNDPDLALTAIVAPLV